MVGSLVISREYVTAFLRRCKKKSNIFQYRSKKEQNQPAKGYSASILCVYVKHSSKFMHFTRSLCHLRNSCLTPIGPLLNQKDQKGHIPSLFFFFLGGGGGVEEHIPSLYCNLLRCQNHITEACQKDFTPKRKMLSTGRIFLYK